MATRLATTRNRTAVSARTAQNAHVSARPHYAPPALPTFCLHCGIILLAGEVDLCAPHASSHRITTDVHCDACGDEEPLGSVNEPCMRCRGVGTKRHIKLVAIREPGDRGVGGAR